MPEFEFATAARIVLGSGTAAESAPAVRALGRRVLVLHGRSAARTAGFVSALARAGCETATCPVPHEPDTGVVVGGASIARDFGADVVVGVGGGSVLDAAKAVSALAANDGDVFEYLEVVGRAQPLLRAPLPCVAVPTTAGTGSEVTRNAVLTAREHRVKVSLRSPLMLPRLAIVDAALTRDLPPELTAATGLDALTQLIEPFLSRRANPMTDLFAQDGMRRAATALPAAWRDGHDEAARAAMMLASLYGGLALANAGLGAVHGLAGPIGGRYTAPHGAVCAALLPHVLAANVRALRERAPASPALARFATIARLLTGRDTATAGDAIDWIGELTAMMAIPRLGVYGIDAADAEALADAGKRASSMQANPIELTRDELAGILMAAL